MSPGVCGHGLRCTAGILPAGVIRAGWKLAKCFSGLGSPGSRLTVGWQQGTLPCLLSGLAFPGFPRGLSSPPFWQFPLPWCDFQRLQLPEPWQMPCGLGPVLR